MVLNSLEKSGFESNIPHPLEALEEAVGPEGHYEENFGAVYNAKRVHCGPYRGDDGYAQELSGIHAYVDYWSSAMASCGLQILAWHVTCGTKAQYDNVIRNGETTKHLHR